MKKLLILITSLLFTITAYSQNGYSSVFLRVTDSATFVNSANTVAKHAADYADIWYSVNSGLFWEWDAGTSAYVILGSKSIGAYGWLTNGTTTLTGGADINLNSNSVVFTDGGDTFLDIASGAASIQGHSGSDNTLIEATPTTAVMQNNNNNKVEVNAAGVLIRAGNTGDDITLTTASTARLTIDNDGSFDLGAGLDPGTATHVLTSNGAGAAPTWQAGGGISDGNKGDITVSSSGTVWNIDAGVVAGTEIASDVALAGNPTTTTQTLGNSTTRIATTAFVQNQVGKAWTDWSASVTPTGFSSTTTVISFYKDDGSTVTVYYVISGTSNATTFTVQLPVAMNANYGTDGFIDYAWVLNNANPFAGLAVASGGSTTLNIYTSAAVGVFTNTGTKVLRATFTYRK